MMQNDIWVLAWLLAGLYQTVARTLVARGENGQDYSNLHMTIPFHELDYNYGGQRAGLPLPAEHVDIVEVRRAHDPSTGGAGRRADYSDESWDATTPNSLFDENASYMADLPTNMTQRQRRQRFRPGGGGGGGGKPRLRSRPDVKDDRDRYRGRRRGRERDRGRERLTRQRRRRRRQRRRRMPVERSWTPRLRRVAPGQRSTLRPKKPSSDDSPEDTKGVREEFLARVDKFRRDLFDQVMRMIRPASFPQGRFLPASPLDIAARAAQTSTSTSTSSPRAAKSVDGPHVVEDPLTEMPLYAARRSFDPPIAQAEPRKNASSASLSTTGNHKDLVLIVRRGLTATTAKAVSTLTTTASPRNGASTVQLHARALDPTFDANHHSSSGGLTKEGNPELQLSKPVTSKTSVEVRSNSTTGDERTKSVPPLTEISRPQTNKAPELANGTRDQEAQKNAQVDVVAVPRAAFYGESSHNNTWNSTHDTPVARQMSSSFNCAHKLE